MLDEPTEGLMPSMIAKIRDTVAALRGRGVSTILVEQRVDAVLPVADRVMFVENGRSRETVDVEVLRADPALVHRYVGVGGDLTHTSFTPASRILPSIAPASHRGRWRGNSRDARSS